MRKRSYHGKKRVYATVGWKFHRSVKRMAASRGITVREYVLEAVGKQLYLDLTLERDQDDQPYQSFAPYSGEGL